MGQGKPQTTVLNRSLAKSMGVVFATNFMGRGNRRDLVRQGLMTNNAGVTFTTGAFGTQANFASNAYLSRGPVLTQGNYTVIVRVKINSTTGGQVIVSEGTAGGATRMNLNYGSGAANKFTFSVNGGNYAVSNGNPVIGQWYHVACTYEVMNANHTYWMFVNGVKQTTGHLTAAVFGNNTFRIGLSSFGDGPLNGSVAEVVVCNRKLTDQQINYHYRNPWALYRPQPVYSTALVPAFIASPHLLFRRFA